jgi:microcystin-dependent protein
MADNFVAEIRMFGCNFAPLGWATCDGQILAISQNTALFSLLGTIYGGNGQSTFALPNLQGRSPMFWGQGPGLTARVEGEQAGTDNITLLTSEMPLHNHSLMAKPIGGQADPVGRLYGTAGTQLPPPNFYADALGTAVLMNPLALPLAGGSQPHNNLMPYQVITFCIALQGIFPARN